MSGPSGLTGSVCHDTDTAESTVRERDDRSSDGSSTLSLSHLIRHNALRLARYLRARNGSF